MVKVNKYLFFLQLLNVIDVNIIQCAATIQTKKESTHNDLELIRAAKHGNKKKVEELIEKGANVNAVDSYGWPVLTWAAEKGHKEIVELLIKEKANVNTPTKYNGTTALIQAIGHKEIVELLIKAHADVNAADRDGWTALMWSIAGSKKKIIEMLLKAGTDLEHKNEKGQKAIELARIYPDTGEIVKMLEDEPARRQVIVTKWIKENLAKKINETTSGQLIPDISKLIAEYAIVYNDLPLDYRLNN